MDLTQEVVAASFSSQVSPEGAGRLSERWMPSNWKTKTNLDIILTDVWSLCYTVREETKHSRSRRSYLSHYFCCETKVSDYSMNSSYRFSQMLADSSKKYFHSGFPCLQETSGKGQTEQQKCLFYTYFKFYFFIYLPLNNRDKKVIRYCST